MAVEVVLERGFHNLQLDGHRVMAHQHPSESVLGGTYDAIWQRFALGKSCLNCIDVLLCPPRGGATYHVW